MKKFLLILSFITGLTAIANAQFIQKSPEQRAAHMTKVLQKRLNLTQDQASKINSAFLTRATRMDSLKNNPSTDKKLNQLTRRDITLSTQRQVVDVLNNDQRKKFMEMEKMMRAKHREHKAQGTNQQG